MKVKPETLRLYAVTDRAWLHGRTLESQVEQAVLGGATIVQLREKHLTGQALLTEAKALFALCRRYGVPFLVNDDVALALAVGADGVHVGQEDMAAEQARALLGPDKILGVSAHSVAQAVAAQRAGANYLGCGAAFVTGTKTDARPIPRETLQGVTAAVNIPVVAIGGITQGNLPQLQGCGLAGAAVVSALFAQEDVQEAARELFRLAGQL
ncbi:MAG: thiamine phosphate synthase [Clostridiales bacterium]|nr:thiamine phosphate synthase [Clostridiales bacterium]